MPFLYPHLRTLEPEFAVLQRMAELDWLQDPDTVSGAPPPLEAHWAALGQPLIRSRYLPNAPWLAWRWLVAMALTGWHWLPDFELNPDSTVSVPQAPGLGVNVDRARLAAVTLRAETFRASN